MTLNVLGMDVTFAKTTKNGTFTQPTNLLSGVCSGRFGVDSRGLLMKACRRRVAWANRRLQGANKAVHLDRTWSGGACRSEPGRVRVTLAQPAPMAASSCNLLGVSRPRISLFFYDNNNLNLEINLVTGNIYDVFTLLRRSEANLY